MKQTAGDMRDFTKAARATSAAAVAAARSSIARRLMGSE